MGLVTPPSSQTYQRDEQRHDIIRLDTPTPDDPSADDIPGDARTSQQEEHADDGSRTQVDREMIPLFEEIVRVAFR